MFIALFGTANYFARLANYFLIFQTLALPWMLSYFDYKSKKTLRYEKSFDVLPLTGARKIRINNKLPNHIKGQSNNGTVL